MDRASVRSAIIVLGALAVAAVLYARLPFEAEVRKSLGLTVFIGLLWLTEALPLAGLEVRALRDATSTLLKASIIPTSGTCFRRRAALAAGLMPQDFRSGEDWLFWLRLSGQGRFVFQLDDLVRHHRHDDNLTHPRASEFIAREKLRGFLALLDGSMRVSLTPEETNRARRLAKQCQANWLYHLSRLGMRPYLSGLQSDVGKQIGGGYGRILSDPRSFLRSIACSLLRP